ncbi:MAG: hypothetical protein RMX97_10195 [Nostoc sp. DedQUE11]|nr:hypothetical protein [Nostoc sp. DedQUE11]
MSTVKTTKPTLTSPKKRTVQDIKKIYVLGPQASGKTTYLSALALLLKSQNPNHKLVTVTAQSDDAIALEQDGKSQWMNQTPLLPTDLAIDPSHLPEYKFSIEVSNYLRSNPLKIILTAKDYGGEFFQDLLQYPQPTRLKSYLRDCMNAATGWIIMLPDFSLTNLDADDIDSEYQDILQILIREAKQKDILRDLRLAIVMSKCERGELWPSRWEPERDLFKVRLPKTTEFLRKPSLIPQSNVSFFALSSFGVLARNDPRPNRYTQGNGSAVLNNRDSWLPHGLINPLYWIATGNKWKNPSF